MAADARRKSGIAAEDVLLLAIDLDDSSVPKLLKAKSAAPAGTELGLLVRQVGSSVVDTELPAAATLADNTATPTAPAVGAFGMMYDGATWDMVRGDATNGLKVQPAVGGAGAVTAQTERVTLASDDPAVTALQIIDDWDETDRAKVNIIVGQAGVTAGAGVVAANTPRTTLASDDPAVVALQIIDDWDETDRAKVNPIVGQAGIQGGAGAVSANTVRVALATDAAAVTQASRNNLLCNASLQIGGTDVSATVPVPTKDIRSATATVTAVADNAASVTLLASNANRLGASIENSSTARLHIKLGTTATTTDYTVSLAQYGLYEVPFGYTGRIDGIWASDPNAGSAHITEFTA